MQKAYDLGVDKFMCLEKKGLKDIYLTANEYAEYTDTTFGIILQTQAIEKLKKGKLSANLLKSVTRSEVTHFLNLELSKKAVLSFENYSQICIENDEVFKILESLNSSKIDLLSHVAKISFLTTAMANNWKWTHPKNLTEIVMASLLCELGLRHCPELVTKNA